MMMLHLLPPSLGTAGVPDWITCAGAVPMLSLVLIAILDVAVLWIGDGPSRSPGGLACVAGGRTVPR